MGFLFSFRVGRNLRHRRLFSRTMNTTGQEPNPYTRNGLIIGLHMNFPECLHLTLLTCLLSLYCGTEKRCCVTVGPHYHSSKGMTIYRSSTYNLQSSCYTMAWLWGYDSTEILQCRTWCPLNYTEKNSRQHDSTTYRYGNILLLHCILAKCITKLILCPS